MFLYLQIPARSSEEELGKDCRVALATDYALNGGEDKREGSTHDKQETWNKVPQSPVRYGSGSEVDQLLPLFFTAFIYHIPLGFFYFLECFRSSEISFIAPTLCTAIPSDTFPFFSMQLCLQLSSLFSSHMSLPAFTLLHPTSNLEVIWRICGQVRAWQCFEVWVYHAQSDSTGDKSQGPAPGCSWCIGKGVYSSGNSETHSWSSKSTTWRKTTSAQHKVALARDKLDSHQNSPLLHSHRGEWEVFLICPLNCLAGLHSAPGLSPYFWARAPALLPCFFSCCLLTPSL